MNPKTAPDLSLKMHRGDRDQSADQTVADYHEKTKHHYHRYAASSGYLDWANQPDPFRRYDGAPLVQLHLPDEGRALPFWQLYVADAIEPEPLSMNSIALFFRYALSLTAWKRFEGSTWSLRSNPSSGNLHPTEGYAILPPLAGLHSRSGVCHYAPKEHALELRADFDAPSLAGLAAGYPEGSFLVGLSSILWREAWKYGERAFRYCQHDVGHALGAIRFAAAALGWKVYLLEQMSSAAVAQLLGLDREADSIGAEREHPELMVLVTHGESLSDRGLRLSQELVSRVSSFHWYGTANTLSPVHSAEWPLIDQVAEATVNLKTTSNLQTAGNEEFIHFRSEEELFGVPVRSGAFTAERVILGRRSAVSMDAATEIPAATFFKMLARLVPTRNNLTMPWDALSWKPRIHLGLFVHRVSGLPSGLYMLVRDPDKVEVLRQAMHPDFQWQRLPACPPELPLFLLKEEDCRSLAATVSCGQGIAGDGVFSLGMIAEFRDTLADLGASFYRNLFWEAGLVGQLLYLEAEEAGIRATGIGCYFDDAVHEVFGIRSRAWQSLYHFTVGGPVADERLTSLPGYNFEKAG
jgi:SagB-type dehydrogenase family enzyme